MKKLLMFAAVLALILTGFAAAVAAAPITAAADREKTENTGDWIVAFTEEGEAAAALAAAKGMTPLVNEYYAASEAAAEAVADDDAVRAVFPAAEAELSAAVNESPFYNDPEAKGQWGLKAVNIEECWRHYSTGDAKIVVCVIDSGFFYEHPDAQQNFFAGKDYVDKMDHNTFDDTSHGTSCAGIIGATTNNGEGISGLCKDVTVINQRTFYWDGFKKVATTANVAAAIRDAVDIHHASVISMSFLFDESDLEKGENNDLMLAACRYATEKGVILVAAAGNNAKSGSSLCYPAAYDCVIGVGAVDSKLNVADFSARNSSVFCCAPGVSVLTLGNPASKEELGCTLYRRVGGTSMATPFVASLAVMAKTIDPELTPKEFSSLIVKTSKDLGEKGYDMEYGFGLIDFCKAMKWLYDFETTQAEDFFDDVAKPDWFYNAVADVYKNKLMSGVSEREFAPATNLTRGMFATILHRMAGSPKPAAGNVFRDVKADSWYAEAVAWAYQNKVVYGVGPDTFAPMQPITRQELVTMLYRYYNDYEKKTFKIDAGSTTFTDDNAVAAWAKTAVKTMTGAKVLSGYANGDDTYSFRPGRTASRAEAAQILSGLLHQEK